MTINVFQNNSSSIVGTTSLCAGATGSLSILGATNYSWSTGSNSPVIFFAATSGTIFAATSSNPCGTSTNSVYINVLPLPSVSISGSTVCAGYTLNLVASGATSYTWSTGNTSSSITVSPVTNTTYTVIGVDNNNCAKSTSVNINVLPTPSINITGPFSVCQHSTFSMTATGASSYTWSTGSFSATAIVTNSLTGTNQFTVQGTNANGCIGIKTKGVNTLPAPSVSINPTAWSICEGSQTTLSTIGSAVNSYSWSNGSITPTTVVSPSVSTIYSLTVTNSSNCQATDTILVTVNPLPTLSISVNPPSVCAGDGATLSVSGASSYSWSNFSNTNSTVVTPSVTSVFSVTGSNSICANNSTCQVNVYPNPTLTVTILDPTVCAGQSAGFTVTGANSYTWSNGTNGSFSNFVPTPNQTYSVEGTDLNSCRSTSTFSVLVHPTPTLTLTQSNAQICAGQSCTLFAQGANSYTWSTGSVSANIVVSPSTSTMYYVIGSGSNGCNDSVAIIQNVVICTGTNSMKELPSIEIYPNPFQNSFSVSVSEDLINSVIMIVNSLGQQVATEQLKSNLNVISIDHLANGMYYAIITMPDLNQVAKKLIKH